MVLEVLFCDKQAWDITNCQSKAVVDTDDQEDLMGVWSLWLGNFEEGAQELHVLFRSWVDRREA